MTTILYSVDGVRWAFNSSKWSVTTTELHELVEQYVPEQDEIDGLERTRIKQRLRFNDQKQSLAGRLLLRKLIEQTLRATKEPTPWNNPYFDVPLARSKRGKPKFTKHVREQLPYSLMNWNFNISHAGDWVVLASEPRCLVGVDVSKIEFTPIWRKPNFLDPYKSVFHRTEWEFLHQYSDTSRLKQFHRLWTLKEAYVKATGTGLTIDMQTVVFLNTAPKEEEHRNTIYQGTQLYRNGVLQPSWRFDLSYLDDFHPVCVAVQVPGSTGRSPATPWKEVRINDLLPDNRTNLVQ